MSASSNPLLDTDWDAEPLALPPFAAIEPRHFAPAFAVAMREHRAELDAIAANPAVPDFDNSVAAIDRAGALLARVDKVFWNLVASASTPALQAVQRELAPQLAAHDSAMYLDPRLFARLDALHARRDALALSDDDRRLLERLHADFVFAGARLQGAARERCGAIAEQLAALTTRFSQNVLADENAFALELPDEAKLAGLPPTLRAACARAAADRGLTGHVVTLSRSLIEPFLAHSTRRDLREQAWRAWVARGEPANAEVARDIVALRGELAALHGHASYADFTLTDTMAGTRGAVQALLDQVWAPALAAAQREREAIQGAMAAAGAAHALEPWDWRHYAEQVRRARYDLDDAEVKPYFALERVVQAAFDCAGRLFGIRFVPRPDLRAWHDDVQVYEVHDLDGGTLRALFLHDNFARPGKRSGAWMSQLRLQHRDGAPAIPVVVNNNNFAKGEPTLLSFDDARTLFHEFGHGLHGMLSDVRWRRLSGTQVLRDFVELPSQLFEHWIEERDVLQRHARHHVTGAPIPAALIDRVERARRFGSGYATVSYAASALLDLHLHARTDAVDDIAAFERERLAALEAPPAIGPRHRLLHFDHLFAGDAYASKYYVYLWAEVLDADAFDAFVEAGDAFDAATAQRLRDTIYAAGAARDPKEAYRAFRGRDAMVEPMLKGRGLLTAD
jgi:peptidyl-dipeptidase Dcp